MTTNLPVALQFDGKFPVQLCEMRMPSGDCAVSSGHTHFASGQVKTEKNHINYCEPYSKRGRQKKRWEDNIKEWTEWTLPAQLGQLKTGQDGKGLLQIHLWCPDDLPRLWDRIE